MGDESTIPMTTVSIAASPESDARSASDHGNDLVLKKVHIARWRLVTILAWYSLLGSESNHPCNIVLMQKLYSIGMGLFLSLMDTTIVATMLLSISEEFGGFRLSSWVVLSYTLAYVACAVLIARLSDAMGRKSVLCISFTIFLAASMACGASQNLDQLIGFRAAQGVGGAGLYSMTMIIYPEICPPAMVPLISSILGIIVALAGVSGPVIGGLLTTYRDWRYVFWINGPCAFVPGIVLFFVWPSNFQSYTKVRFRHLDYLGTLFILVGTVLLVFIINQGAVREYAWSSAPTIAVFVLSGLSWIGLVFWQWEMSRRTKLRHIRPQFPFRILSNRVMMATIICTILNGFVMFLVIINIPMRAQIVHIYDAIKSGVLLLPLMGSTAVGSMLGGALSSKKNRTFWTLNAASSFMLIGTGLLSTLPTSVLPTKSQYGYQVLLGLGLGLNLSTSTFMTSLNVEFEDHAVAQGIVAQMRVFGGSIGVAAGFIVLNSLIQQKLTGVLSPQQLDDFYRTPIVITSFNILQQLEVRRTYIQAFTVNMQKPTLNQKAPGRSGGGVCEERCDFRAS
ncbi:uncharacterized protein E0L32_002127 [Thyridium curvatum]|uniref:Major facilitator superfamily (MFS) profile domain-containing protein n=1 Tax=Thyridium curvatum TaxID=1093900 RepID=A0A507AJB4_9PEZI|nr:uncharacterized protein E0L32_002006 [Thyridium curvatum]XP_030989235.1 uncharacterized protein E0L32_002127 [Thyridium curvatum]TPX07403.1 hypothetical protein E0L32_002006 [Thyridium curvatum]TPX07524.1 hypothetical protein E0L32_002127 [Thyridium curvatum]